MRQYEKDEIQQLPDKYKPLGAWKYFGYQILFSLPIIGFIALVICACSRSNINRRSYARSYFCVLIIVLIIGGISLILMYTLGVGSGLWEALMEFVKGFGQQ